MMNLRYKYRIYPSAAQEQKLWGIVGSCRFVWNYFLAAEQQQYNQDKTFRFYSKNCHELTLLKRELDWLKQSPATALQQSIRNLDLALRQSFKSQANRKGFPKFKSKKHFQGSFTLAMIGNNADQAHGTFKIPNVGRVKTKYHRAIPSEFSTCQVKCEANKWYLVLTVKVKKQTRSSGTSSVGIDLNSLEYVTSDAEVIPIPRFLGESQAQIKRIQLRLARKTRGSSNRRKQLIKLARAHYRVRCRRLDFFHKLSLYFVNNYDIICLEDLNVRGIQQFNGHIIKDNMFSGFRQMIEYKAELYGREIRLVDRYYTSTKTCSCCGNIQTIALDERIYKCTECGVEIPRDYNAALNINRAGTVRIYASGVTVRPSDNITGQVTMNEETYCFHLKTI